MQNVITWSRSFTPPQSAEYFRTTILKVGSKGKFVREIKRIQQLNSQHTVAGAARCNLEIAGKCSEWARSTAPTFNLVAPVMTMETKRANPEQAGSF
jgi:hypothetical protein